MSIDPCLHFVQKIKIKTHNSQSTFIIGLSHICCGVINRWRHPAFVALYIPLEAAGLVFKLPIGEQIRTSSAASCITIAGVFCGCALADFSAAFANVSSAQLNTPLPTHQRAPAICPPLQYPPHERYTAPVGYRGE